MKYFLFISLLLAFLNSHAQTPANDTTVYARPDINPIFPGGADTFQDYVEKNSPKLLKPDHAMGRVVAQIVIEKDGRMTHPVLLRKLTPETDSAAIYLLEHAPLWKPGFKNGVPVRIKAIVPVDFSPPQKYSKANVPQAAFSQGKNAEVTIDEPVGTIRNDNPDKLYTAVERIPQFPGGPSKFYQFISKNLKSPSGASGREIIMFVIEKDGSLTDIKVVRSVSPECDKEALRVMSLSPKWDPGIQNGHPVRVQYSVPINFDTDN